MAESLSSPFGLFAKTEPAVFGAIAFWCAVGALLGSVRDWVARLLFLLSMVAQYIVLSVILWRQSLLQPWWSNEKYHEVMLYAIIGYSLGQTAIWVLFFYEVLLVGFKQTQVDSAATDHSRLND